MHRSRLALAVCSAVAIDVALAPCAFALPKLTDAPTIEMQLTPAGEFTPVDGREMLVDAWRIDAAIAARVIARHRARLKPPVLDYEHQTLHKETNGQPAPAAGWIDDLVWHEGRGLFAIVKLTDRARALIAADEYRYISPVLVYDKRTGEVLAIEMAAITNHAAIHGMEPLQLRAAATFGIHSTDEGQPMNKLLLAMIAAFAMTADATEDDAIAVLTAAKSKVDGYNGLLKAAGIADDTKHEVATAALTSLKTKADNAAVVAGNPDPAKFVPIALVESLKTEIASLTSSVRGREVDEVVRKGLDEGRLLPAQEKWARELGASDIAALTAYLAATSPIAALTQTQTRGQPPATDADGNLVLSAEELAVCTATGIAPQDFAAAKAVGIAA